MKDRSVFILLLVILCTSMLAIFQYDHNVRTEYEDERKFYFEKNHEKAFSSFSLFTERMNSLYRQILLNRDIASWLNNPGELIEDMYKLSQIQNSFIDLINTNSGLMSVYLYNQKNNMVISTPFMLSELQDFPNKAVFETFYNSKETFIWDPFGPEFRTGTHNSPIISMAAAVPSQGSSNAVSINFSEAYIADLMGDNPFLIWLDANNDVLMSKDEKAVAFFNANKKDIVGMKQTAFVYKDHFIVSSESEAGRWKLLTILPMSELMKGQSSKNTYVALLFALGAAMAGLLFLYFRYVRRAQERQVRVRLERTLDDSQKGLVSDLLTGKPVLGDLKEKLQEYRMDLSGSAYQVIVFQIDNYYNFLLSKGDAERLMLNKMIFNSIKWTFALRFQSYTVNTEFDKVTVLLSYRTLEDSAARLEKTIRYIQDDIRDYSGLTVCAGVGGLTPELDHIHTGYAQAMTALDYKAVYGKHALIHFDQLPSSQTSSYLQWTQDIHRIHDDLKEGRLDRIEQRLNDILEQIISGESFTLDRIHAIFANLMSAIMKFVIEHRIDINEQCGEDVFMTLYSYEFVEEKKAYLLHICSVIIELLRKEPEAKNETARLIMDYIDKHFDQPISLGIMADQLSLSPSYLSVAIKNHLGVGFVEYINKLRVQKAVSLLEDDGLAVQQIAELCGYDTVHTFIRQFKKAYGMPPNEYRTKRRNSAG